MCQTPLPPAFADSVWSLGLAHRCALAQLLPSLGLVPLPSLLHFGCSLETAACPLCLLINSADGSQGGAWQMEISLLHLEKWHVLQR